MAEPTFAPSSPDSLADAVAEIRKAGADQLLESRQSRTTVDATVTSGNRLKTAAQMDATSPQAKLEAKIDGAFNEGMGLLSDLRAGADQLEALLNKLRVGF